MPGTSEIIIDIANIASRAADATASQARLREVTDPFAAKAAALCRLVTGFGCYGADAPTRLEQAKVIDLLDAEGLSGDEMRAAIEKVTDPA